MPIREAVKDLTVLGAIFGAKAKKLTGLCDALHTVTDNLTFTAPDQITLTVAVPNFLGEGTYFRVTNGGGANENVLFKVLSISGKMLTLDTSVNTVSSVAVLATIDARLATVISDTNLVKLNSQGNTIFNVNRMQDLGFGNCFGIGKVQAEHFHDAPAALCEPYQFTFGVGDFFSSDAGDTYSFDVVHNLNTTIPKVTVYEDSVEVLPHAVRIIDPNTVRIKVAQAGSDCRFAGFGVVDC